MADIEKIRVIAPTLRERAKADRLIHEHDMNDAIFARLDFVDKLNTIQKTKEEGSINKATQKSVETAVNKKRGMTQLIIIHMLLAPLTTYFYYLIYKKITGG